MYLRDVCLFNIRGAPHSLNKEYTTHVIVLLSKYFHFIMAITIHKQWLS